jgi:hypothetical protein
MAAYFSRIEEYMRMYRLTVFALIACAFSLTSSSLRAGIYGGGTGEPNAPYRIGYLSHWVELMAAPSDWGKSFMLTGDVDLAEIPLTPVGSTLVPFTGALDGDGHVIRNVCINTPEADSVGLFGDIGSGAQVRNVRLEAVYIIGRYNVGGLAGNSYGTVSKCDVSGYVSGFGAVGGLVGTNSGPLDGCSATSSVSGTNDTGGLVGWNYGLLEDCRATGPVSGYQEVGGLIGLNTACLVRCYAGGAVGGASSVGGLVGYNALFNNPIVSCYATGNVTQQQVGVTGGATGGLIGTSEGPVYDCYAVGDVNGTSYVGGLVGYTDYAVLGRCYACGRVSGEANVAGLIGGIGLDGYAENCLWDSQATGQSAGSGSGSSDGVYGRTTEQMKQQAAFTSYGWDFLGETANGAGDVWRMCQDGADYPKLNWQSAAGNFACPDGVNVEDLSYLAQWWLAPDCILRNNCGGVDIDASGSVDFADFALMAANWMR